MNLAQLPISVAAYELLWDTNRPVVEVGLVCGYADQSAFTRQFRRTIGMSPLEYRESHRSLFNKRRQGPRKP